MEIKVELSKKLKPKPNFNKLGFGKFFTDHMFVMDYTNDIGWHDPRIVPYSNFEIPPASLILHYGQSVFEGLKAYKTKADGKITLFRPQKNFERLNKSNNRLCIPQIDVDFALEALCKLVSLEKDWIPTNEGTALYIRPFIFATESMLGIHPSNTYKFVIILSPVGSYLSNGLTPVNIAIESNYVRAVKGGSGHVKASANYAISLKGQVVGKSKGFDQVLWLDGVEKKYIEEVGSMNIFFKIGGKLVTPLADGSILEGITRDSIITLAKSWGYEVVEKKISIQELYEAFQLGKLEESFGCGTAAVVSPIGKFLWEDKEIIVSNGQLGKFTKKLYNHLTGIQYGKEKDEFDWIREVK
ncbi:branched-chain amino acid aminotransferase [Anaerophilus nitritogenes]|uniref:branched-chain amino acid aminotransferase n=1 Tax=Anaerophilus nitritogenes TaxID=2498136 RepID=UPI00101D3E43|nr:branched-chain amino acid aminotransferase [Anaerophilus nitritogenes]